MNENFDDIEKMLREQKIRKVPPHLMARFTEEVLERIDQKPRPRFAFRLFPVLVPAAVGIILTSVFLLPDLNEKKSGPALSPAPRAAMQTAKAPMTLEQLVSLVDEIGEGDELDLAGMNAFSVADSGEDASGMSLDDQMRLLEDLGANHVDDDVLTDEEAVLYELGTFTSARG